MNYCSVLILLICLVVTGCSSEKGNKNALSVNGREIHETQIGSRSAKEEKISSGNIDFKGCSEIGKVGLEWLSKTEGKLYTLYYDYGRFNIRDECKGLLDRNIEWMTLNPDIMIYIGGHTDERGELGYNLAIGSKMALIIARYLKEKGINQNRFRTIGYGDEHPVDKGHNEAAWAKNRRIEFVIH